MRRLAAVSTVIVLACTPAPSPRPEPVPATTAPAAAPITADELRRDLVVFASDSFRGREAGTPDELRAARFLAGRLQQMGVEPAGDSGYFHRITLFRQRFGNGTSLRVIGPSGTTTLGIGQPLLPMLALGPGADPRLAASGDLVFAGYGVSLPSLGRNDLANLDVTGKVVVVVNGAPASADSAQRSLLDTPAAMTQRLQQFVAMQPAAIVILLTGAFGDEFAETYVPALVSQMFATPPASTAEAQRRFPMILIGRMPQGPSPLLPTGWPADDRAQPLAGRRFEGRVEIALDTVRSYNVAGVVRGSDARLASTYVAFGSHFDHIGIQPAVDGDSIANGADDDGSGTIGMLAVARHFQDMPRRPRRSMLFVFHTAEEKGLLGSARFVERPTVPLDSIVAMVNADMIGRNHPDSLYIVGPAAAPQGQSRVLGVIADSVNAAMARPFGFDRAWDSETHPERIYFRSDHYNYAARGIPVVFFTSGLHDDYHQVGDETSKIDFEKLTRVTRLFVGIGTALGNRATRPR